MNLHENKELFQDSVLAAAQHFGIPEIYIEKDYWVTLALYEIFHDAIADQVVFKGGTALSKCHKLIERFSEDVDLVVLRNEDESDNQMKKKIRTISKIVEKTLPEVEIEGITNKMGNIRKTAHQYDKLFRGDLGQVREHLIIEATWLGNYDPYSKKQVSSYITEMMKATGQDEMIAKYNMQPFEVQVLTKERTLCEKIMSLVRFSQTEDPYTDLANKIRHVYDIHLMLKDKEVEAFFESDEFDKMMLKVGNDDVISFKNNKDWLPNHPSKALIFAEPEETWDQIKTAYRTTFKDLVTGELPKEEDLITSLKRVAERLKPVTWDIKV